MPPPLTPGTALKPGAPRRAPLLLLLGGRSCDMMVMTMVRMHQHSNSRGMNSRWSGGRTGQAVLVLVGGDVEHEWSCLVAVGARTVTDGDGKVDVECDQSWCDWFRFWHEH